MNYMQYGSMTLLPMNSKRANDLLKSLYKPEYISGSAQGIVVSWRCRLIEALERVKELERENESLRSDLLRFQMEDDARGE